MTSMTLTNKDLASFNDDVEFEKNVVALNALGGLEAIAQALNTDLKNGLSRDELTDEQMERRCERFGKNEFPAPPTASWMDLFLESFEDTTIIVLVVAAVVSLAVGLYEDPAKGWIEGAAILSAVLVVAIVTSTNNYNKEKQFRKLNAVKEDVSVTVKRDGQTITLRVKELMVGDIVELNAGDKVPADGLLVSGSDVSTNESSLTGEPDDVKKSPDNDLFLLSGTSLSSGFARMLITAVGEQSRWGKTKAKLAVESAETPLQQKLDVLAQQIGHFGMAAAVLTFFTMIALYVYKPEWRERETVFLAEENVFVERDISFYEFLLKAFIMGVTIVVVAVPEGLPLAVTLSLAFSTQKMMKDNNLIRVLAACETMGNATNICSDKTGTLTQNRMTVVAGVVGGAFFEEIDALFDGHVSSLTAQQKTMIANGIAVNSTANLVVNPPSAEYPSGETVVLGSKTEGALLLFLRDRLGVEDYLSLRTRFDARRGDRLLTFSSARKRMSVLLYDSAERESTGMLYTKGASEILLSRCAFYYDTERDCALPLTRTKREEYERYIDAMAKNALRTVAVAHRLVTRDPLEGVDDDALESELVLDAIFGIKDPLRPDVPAAVRACQEAGIFVRMVTGDNIETAKAIARECGILTEGGIAMEGPDFRRLSPAQLDLLLPRLQVLARSSPDDKHILVTRLNGHALPANREEWEVAHPDHQWDVEREFLLPGYAEEWAQGGLRAAEVVGVTGDGTNDGPAMKAADVGLSMGLSGTEVAKEASDIVILDDNFSSIVKSVLWGRAVFDNIRKFLQFQLTVNVVALCITFLCALTGQAPPLNAVMMLWVNLIMDTMGALALGTEPPEVSLLQRKPFKRNASLISRHMIRNIAVQCVFQLCLLVFLLRFASPWLHVTTQSTEHLTVVFNTFVFCQVFNEINARSIGDDFDVFRGLSKNRLFVAIIVFTVVAQVFIVQFGGEFVKTAPLSVDQWMKCISLGALSLPVGALMRMLSVHDNDADWAPVSPLITEHLRIARESESLSTRTKREAEKHRQDAQLTPSFFLWVAVVAAIPVIALRQFTV